MPIKNLFGIDPERRTTVPTGLRGSGVTGGEGLFDKYFNQIILEIQANHVINTEAKVKAASPVEGTAYFNSTAGEFQDKDDVATVFASGQKIVWAGLDAITAAIDLSAYDDIKHDYIEGITIAFGSQNVTLGSNQSGFLNATGTGDLSATNSPDFVVNGNRPGKLTDFQTKNLTIVNASVSSTDVDAEFVRILDAFNNALLITALNETFAFPGDLNAGSEKASTRYQHWIGVDYLGNVQRLLVPDLTGTTDSTTAGSLEDSTADFVTDAVQVGDIVKNLTDSTETTVSAVTDLNTLALDNDIFVSGEDYEINIETPQFDAGKVFKAKLGSDLNDGGSDLAGDIIFTQFKTGVLQLVPKYTSTHSTTAAAIPQDNTKPQNTEGVELVTQSFTPESSTSNLVFDVQLYGAVNPNSTATAAMFVDSTADSIGVSSVFPGTANGVVTLNFRFVIPSGSKTARTYKMRVGPAAQTLYINGVTTGAQYDGAVLSGFTITEIEA